ncbi:MAG: benzoate transporter [Rhizobiales bacterium PAR1]|nr:MAG: benzoate transporter [Rhizobiales bacterium PAR1]
MGMLEPFSDHRPTIREIWRDIGPVQLATGFVAFLFGATGPLAIILSVGKVGGLSDGQLASFVFAVFFINGLITLALTWAYRQPIGIFWTIPGTVLIGPALTHLSFPEVVGAFYVTSLLVIALGWSGLAKKFLQWVPMPIVMSMVAGVFLRFGLDIIRALDSDFALAGAMVAAFLLLSVFPRIARFMPPIFGALVVGAIIAYTSGRLDFSSLNGLEFVRPLVVTPVFSTAALVELVIPLAITIIIVQHGQGLAVLTNAGHTPPMTAITVVTGIGGLLSAVVGAVGSSLTGPTNGLITSAGPKECHYATALVTALIAMLFGLLSPNFTALMLSTPRELIMALGGLAMLRVLQASFVASFKGPFSFGALVCLLVTVADKPLLHIGSAFWGLVAGVAIAALLEPKDFKQLR